MGGVISLVNDLSIDCVLLDGRVSLAHLLEFSHFVDLYVLEDEIYLDDTARGEGFAALADHPDSPLEQLSDDALNDSVFEISRLTRDIYDSAPINHSFSIESYKYWSRFRD